MAPPNKPKSGKLDPDLTRFVSNLTPPIDEDVLAKVQISLETLLSEKAHPMLSNLKRQLDLLNQAESVLQHEIESRQISTQITPSVHDQADVKLEDISRIETQSQSLEEDQEMRDANSPLEDGETDSQRPSSAETNTQEDQSCQSLISASGDVNKNSESSSNSSQNVTVVNKINGNNKFVPNPKAEYVDSQPLPVTQFELFEDDDDDEDDERLKRKLGVVSFPKEDLSTLTAGPVPMEDFTNARPTNQVQYSTYATFIESYFRNFTDEDVHFLQQPTVSDGTEAANLRGGKKLSAFTFPPLGPHYKQQWAAQDAEIGGLNASTTNDNSNTDNNNQKLDPHQLELSNLYTPKSNLDEINATSLDSPDKCVSLGPLTERLMGALFPDAKEMYSGGQLVDVKFSDEPITTSIPLPKTSLAPIEDFMHLEDRVKSEFRYVGLLDIGLLRKFDKNKSEFKLALSQPRDDFGDPTAVDIDWVNGAEDDEISRELRILQKKLKTVSQHNVQYKEKLLPVIKDMLAWQGYQSILQDLDKQVDQAYLRKLKAPKVQAPKTKKKRLDSPMEAESSGSKMPDQKPAFKAVMAKRERWINNLGVLFKPAYLVMREYDKPKFEVMNEEDMNQYDDDDEEHEEQDVGNS